MADYTPSPTISDTHLKKMRALIGDVQGYKIGITLNNSDGKSIANISDLLCNLPRLRLNDTYFYLLSPHENNIESYLLGSHLVSMAEFIGNYQNIALMISCLDCVITCNNEIAHIAGAMDKDVWLLIPDDPDDNKEALEFTNKYKHVTPFRKLPGENWIHVFLKVSLHWLLVSSKSSNSLTADEIQIDQDMHVMVASTEISDTDDLIKLIDAQTPPFINVMIETTTICNLKCSYCPNSSVGRPAAFMEEHVFRRIIDSIADYNCAYNGRISPHFFGEPLLDPRLEMLMQYSRKKLPASSIVLFTNGERLTVERYISLKEAGVTTFIVSQHTPEPSATVMSTLKTIQDEYPQLYDVIYVDQYHSTEKTNRGGLVEPTGPIKLFIRCNSFLELTFDVHGNAILCCNDYLSSQSFGNITTNTIQDIWEGSAYRRARNLLAYSYFPFEICGKCFKFCPS